ncbi:MAG: class I tRNA ligase family protein [Opitutaceae bacterium]|jgi:methionyl-tRNA synthetase|nr:class I tRNA ligase family protein [Opitutaceae bacterium]
MSEQSKPFYITTAIDYANGSPHLGHAYEKVLSDVIARHQRLLGRQVHFLTGLDEHGQKVQQSAREQGVSPQQFCDSVATQFQDLCRLLDISNDDFIRTTEARHQNVVRALLQKLFDKGEIHKASYSGFYSTRQEQFLLEKDRNPDGSWPEIYGNVTQITETNYFFRLAPYQQWLIDHIKTHPGFIFPRYRQKQVLEFLNEPLNDLCISRPRERLEWGIPLPFDETYVTYVWFDALVNYYSATVSHPGLWPADFHVIGKDILVPPHAVYWPIMLKALGIPAPKSLLVHGWWSVNGSKMSKTTGNYVDPVAFSAQYGVDALRYFLVREMSVGQDSDFSHQQFLARYNAELANNLGNLVNRALNMTNRFAGATIPAPASEPAPGTPEDALAANWNQTRDDVLRLYDALQYHTGLERLFAFITATNAYIEQRAPWKLGKSADPADQALLQTVIATMTEALRLAAVLLTPVTPGTCAKIATVLGVPWGVLHKPWLEQLHWGTALTGAKVAPSAILFPRPQPQK